ncbi:hypothetical protein MAPG_00951 [Magnaporthiopsis poae ATCC 64411]|uniref:Peptidase S8/S53 domain-containing protein n=1 Tax=Magnaporthiopsis poae (strain ATCC 64411 / 73-15) TaxID=644358 RepID=A0A0C4DME5_MAGP6|nr:hypothetical protein MAPG_00951 [Magnaporthiopsis poae ATCC 64411]
MLALLVSVDAHECRPGPALQRAPSLKIGVSPTELARPFDLRRIVRELIKARPRVLVDFEDDSGQTPFQARLASLQRNPDIEDVDARQDRKREIQRNKLIDKDEILSYMREYIGTFSRADAVKALYKVGGERVHEFDLSGLPRPIIDPDYLKGLQKVLWFEGLLKYVALPRLVFEADEGQGVMESNADGSAGQGQGNKILTVYASHLQLAEGSRCQLGLEGDRHRRRGAISFDQVIEECLNGLNVRIWNWFKADLCSDVILKSAKNARDLTLYSPGNNAVLKGWSSPEGLAKLEGLERVHIRVQEGLESPKRLEANVTAFKDALGKLRPDVKCTWEPHRPDSNYNAVFTNRNGENQPQVRPIPSVSKWAKAMGDFAEFLGSARPDPSVRPIKIAVIDDGIDMTLAHFANKIQVGESFYSLTGEMSGRRGAYFVPSGPHGTLMAKAICSVCPKVMFYIAQLEILPGPHGQRSFTAESAIEAIKWAVVQGVDIISMGWSINTSVKIPALHEALQAVEHARIIMFCASIDEGAKASDNAYPARASTSCMKIGACTVDGDKLSWVSEENSKFLLPGDAPISAAGDKDQWSPHRHLLAGSSVATARAAGLAAALLYCDRLIGAPRAKIFLPQSTNFTFQMGPGRGIRNHKEVDLLRSNDKITETFSGLSSGSNHKFPQLWQHLPDIQNLEWDSRAHPTDTNETKPTLDAFMRHLRTLRVGGGEELVQSSSTA